jgi:glycosyltransferase involved in cell wall biosynthesis
VDAARRAEEAGLFRSVAAVVTTSVWTRDWLLAEYAVPAELVVVAVPGADRADVVAGTADGGSLLCVGAVTPGKGHDVLLDALAQVDAGCRCTVVGSLVVDPAFAADVAVRADGRVDLVGPFDAQALDAAYHSADVLVLPSRAETYGMVVTEALARGLPVIAAEVGGVPEALGRGADGTRPGLLVPPDDPRALRDALWAWLEDHDLRRRLRRAARERRASLSRWTTTTAAVADVLAGAGS